MFLTRSVLLSQLVQNIRGVEAGVVAQLSGNDLKSASHGSDEKLFFAGDRARVVTQVLAHFHLDRAATC